ncbi:MAG: glycosyltransferase family 4 protein [Gammaproteobacteria bacterium]|nr:hypothetical protein [Gammaproteobacteria bacterium]
MRILIANKFFFRNGGSESVMLAEREYLREAGESVVDFSMRDERNLPSDYAQYFVTHRSYARAPRRPLLERAYAALNLIHSREAVKRIVELIDATRPDLLHCHNVYHQLTPSIIGAARGRGVPVVLTLHDYKPVCPTYTRLRHGRPCSDCLEQRFLNVLRHRCADGSLAKSALLYAEAATHKLMRSYEKVDAVIAPSRFMYRAVTRSRFPPERVHVIPNGIETSRIEPSFSDEGYVLFLGRLSPEKGIVTLLEAHATVRDRVRLRVAGTGPLERRIREQYPHPELIGHVSGSALEETIRRAAFLVVPSEWYENSPLAVLEAMAHGKAVVASDIGGIPELVVHGETGLLFSPGDRDALARSLVTLTQDAELRRRYGAAGRRRAERHFSMERHIDSLLELYRVVLERAREAPSRGRAARSVVTAGAE